ncbi:MAG: hypothetical protein NTY77_13270 [Elusimicrobia bacterium]|nr:hypothetical protein [Elusimicrobiota bacterium]
MKGAKPIIETAMRQGQLKMAVDLEQERQWLSQAHEQAKFAGQSMFLRRMISTPRSHGSASTLPAWALPRRCQPDESHPILTLTPAAFLYYNRIQAPSGAWIG